MQPPPPQQCTGVPKSSVFAECEAELKKHKWIESQKAGRDLGEQAERSWVRDHGWGYLRARWLEHLQGKRFWEELDRDDFGLLQRRFHEDTQLLGSIVDRLKSGKENLDIICWALDTKLNLDDVCTILQALDINSRRLVHRFDPLK